LGEVENPFKPTAERSAASISC